MMYILGKNSSVLEGLINACLPVGALIGAGMAGLLLNYITLK